VLKFLKMGNKNKGQVRLEIKWVDIDDLRPSEYNPRKWTEKEMNDLKESIKRFGIVDPLVVNSAENRKNIVIGGHFRLTILKELGYKKVPVVYVNIPDIKKEKELNLRLNRNLGEFDYDLLAKFDEDLLRDVGFTEEELDEIFGMEIDDSFDVEKELEKVLEKREKRCKEGDLWRLGGHRLYIGDATDRKAWEKLLGEERFDFLFTDPPYQLGWFKNKKGFGYKEQKVYLGTLKMGKIPEYDEWLKIAKDFQNPEGSNVMVFENWKNYEPLKKSIEENGWQIKNMVIWYKLNKYFAYFFRKTFSNRYEIAFYGKNGNATLNEEYEEEFLNFLQENDKLLESYEIIIYGNNKNSYWDKRKGSKWVKIQDHISWVVDTKKSSTTDLIGGTKPIQILVPYIKILSPRNGIVVDCFGGSGSTLIACEIMKRKCRMIEIEPIYAEVILARWEKFTGQKAQKISEK
jgi:DNA modification methylase